jgi:glycosyltransferase involved in cell wall biosynthesis
MSISTGRTSSKGPPRIRVLTLIHVASLVGGAERLAVEIATRLDSDRFDSYFCATRSTSMPTFADRLCEAGVRYVDLDGRSMMDPIAAAKLARLLVSERIDVVHAHLWDSNVWAALIGRLARVPVIVAHFHSTKTTTSFERPVELFLDRQLVRRGASAFIAVSHASARMMRERIRLPGERVYVIPNGIPEPPPGDGRQFRTTLGIPQRAPLVGVASVVRPEKRLDVLIRAAIRLDAEFPNLHVLVAGDGIPGSSICLELEHLAHQLGLAERFRILGFRRDVPDFLAALDVACLCSDFEGMPLSLLEYMAAQRPIVATNVGGIPEVVDDGKEALLVEPNDPVALAEAVAALLREPALAARLGAAAKRRQRAEHDINAMVSSLERLYTDLLQPQAGATTAPNGSCHRSHATG